MEEELCMHCMTDLNEIDREPNGEMPCVCARCLAEEAHDFSKEPRARFDRAGRRIKPTAKRVGAH